MDVKKSRHRVEIRKKLNFETFMYKRLKLISDFNFESKESYIMIQEITNEN